MLTAPMIANIAPMFADLASSLKKSLIAKYPANIKNSISMDVSLASQTHHVPQAGFPHIAPVKIAILVIQMHTYAIEVAAISNKGESFIKYSKEKTENTN